MDLSSDKATGYHLFLEPSGAVKEKLDGVINALAQEYGGPVFVPHITILARIPAGDEPDVIAKAEQLAKEFSPLTFSLGPLHAEPIHFRALYSIICEQSEVKSLHDRANEIFGTQDAMPYLAHISLLYGNYDHERKEKTIATLEYPKGESFVADKLYLYRTEGKPAEWYKAREFSLGANLSTNKQ